MKTKTRNKGRHALKNRISDILKTEGPDAAWENLKELSTYSVINTLFSLLYDLDSKTKWAAVTLMGRMVATIADENMEKARNIMRRLMWNLNDESGGIGWGSPEAMAEIMSRHEMLATEYVPILISYARKDGNFLEHETLQQGLLWGFGRLAGVVGPQLMQDISPYVAPYLASTDPSVRGLAMWVLCQIDIKDMEINFEALLQDDSEVQIYIDPDLKAFRIKDLAVEALRKCRQADSSSRLYSGEMH